jgi:hypothetical protein
VRIITDTKLRFDPVHPARYPELDIIEPCGVLGERYRAKLQNLTGLPDISQEMIELWSSLRHLVTKIASRGCIHKMRLPDAEFESLQSYPDHPIPSFIKLALHKLPESPKQNAQIFKLFGNGVLAHLVIFTVNIRARVAGWLHQTLSTRIRRSLELINVPSFQIAYPEMMLWIIMIGGIASLEAEDRKWFARLLAESCCTAGIKGGNELSQFLTEFLE